MVNILTCLLAGLTASIHRTHEQLYEKCQEFLVHAQETIYEASLSGISNQCTLIIWSSLLGSGWQMQWEDGGWGMGGKEGDVEEGWWRRGSGF